ncbi:hypothetical protein [Streptomyces sp. Ru87]|uniref:hypothetical protein n=1 Tax=Streptomyces sp. Ru87 TaxID=2044307 RepID=UPI000BF4B693|nr:hypothetical protein [Streptomyces sp. Ru87]PGH51929.1 hypothetical protein CRI70_04090 [Streptomyces sp. Ru87]
MTAAGSLTRLLRAALFAAVSVVLAAAGHAAMSGGDIPLPALLAAFGATGGLAWLAGGRRRGVRSIAGTLLLVQGTLHVIFTDGQGALRPGRPTPLRDTWAAMHAAGTPCAPHGAGAMPPAALEQLHSGASRAAPAAGHPSGGASAVLGELTGAAASHTGHATPAMLTAHLLAALCCALWLWQGEAAFFRLLRCLGALALVPLRRLLRTALAAAPGGDATAEPVRPADGTPAVRLRGALLAHVLSRRGPPRAVTTRAGTPGTVLRFA